ncbi:MAG: GDP-fucose synthetase [Candidatus Marinimicrobia bacterium]|nr:GDP-fucose synthetase [Candidatus Neomarinimicrobiota bacterium]
MEGKSLIHLLKEQNYINIVNKVHSEPDLCDNDSVKDYFSTIHPDYVFLFAGKSGGIKANQEMPATLMLDNLRIISNVLSAAHEHKVQKLLFLASSCVYPKDAIQPLKPQMLMTGSLEPTNSAYAMAKLAGIELSRSYKREYGNNFFSAIPANIFGPRDDFSKDHSHVVGALIRKIHEAKINQKDKVILWGTGLPKREFIFVDDLAKASLFLMKNFNNNEVINIGSKETLSISDIAQSIKTVIGFEGSIEFDMNSLDGMPIKTLDSEPLSALGFEAPTSFISGVKLTYEWFLKSKYINNSC